MAGGRALSLLFERSNVRKDVPSLRSWGGTYEIHQIKVKNRVTLKYSMQSSRYRMVPKISLPLGQLLKSLTYENYQESVPESRLLKTAVLKSGILARNIH